MFGDGPLGREICGDEAGIRALPEATIRDFWRTTYRPANTVVAVAGDLDHAEAVELAVAAFGTGNGAVPGFAAGAGAAGRRRASCSASATPPRPSSCVGVPGAPPRPPRQLGAGGPQRDPRRRDEQPAVPVGPRGAGSRLRHRLGPRRLRRCRRPRGLRRGRSRQACRAALEAILAELARLRDEPVPADELAKAKALPVRRAGAADGRDPPRRVVDRRPGGAPRPRPDARRGARPRSRRSTADDIRAGRRRPGPRRGLRLAAVAPARYLRGLERRLRLPGDDATPPATASPRRGRPTVGARPRCTCGSGRSRSPGPSSRRCRRDALDDDGARRPGRGPLADRRPGRGRRGGRRRPGRRGRAAARPGRRRRGRRRPRPPERGPSTGRAGARPQPTARSTPIFAGMPRGSAWPADPSAPPPAPTTMFDAPSSADRGRPGRAAAARAAVGSRAAVPCPRRADPERRGRCRTEALAGRGGGRHRRGGNVSATPQALSAVLAAEAEAEAELGLADAADEPDPADELDRGRAALDAGDVGRAAVRFALVLRLSPSLAPAVLDHVADRRSRGWPSCAAMPIVSSVARSMPDGPSRGRPRARRRRVIRPTPNHPLRPRPTVPDDHPHRRRSHVTERTLVLVKPDGVQRQLVGRILARYEERGPQGRRPQARPRRSRRSPSATTTRIGRSRSSAGWSTSSRRPRSSRSRSRGRTRSRSSARSTARPGRMRRRPARSAATSRSRPPRTSSMRRTAPRRPTTELGAVVRRRRVVRLRARHRPLGARPGGVATAAQVEAVGRHRGLARRAADGPARPPTVPLRPAATRPGPRRVRIGRLLRPAGTNDSWTPSIVGGSPAAASRTPNVPAETARARTASTTVPATALAIRLSDHVRASQARSSVRSSGVMTGRTVGDRRPGPSRVGLRQADEQQPPVVGERPERRRASTSNCERRVERRARRSPRGHRRRRGPG